MGSSVGKGGGSSTPPPPPAPTAPSAPPPPPPPAPEADADTGDMGDAERLARKRAAAGRASTVLNLDSLGGTSGQNAVVKQAQAKTVLGL